MSMPAALQPPMTDDQIRDLVIARIATINRTTETAAVKTLSRQTAIFIDALEHRDSINVTATRIVSADMQSRVGSMAERIGTERGVVALVVMSVAVNGLLIAQMASGVIV